MKKYKYITLLIIFFFLSLTILSYDKWSSFLGDKMYDIAIFYDEFAIFIVSKFVMLIHENIKLIYPFLMCFTCIFFALFIINYINKKNIEIKELMNSKEYLKFFVHEFFIFLKKIYTAITVQLLFWITLVYSFGKASTGIELKYLNGATSKNGNVAFIGGGSKDIGGGGMILGFKLLVIIFMMSLMWEYILYAFKILFKKHVRFW